MRHQSWLDIIIASLRDEIPVARLIILSAKGSTPREAGAELYTTRDTQSGTIGGGTLEFEAVHMARHEMQDLQETSETGFRRLIRDFALGPDLGQCCGGHVRVLIEIFTPSCLGALTDMKAGDAPAYCHDLRSQDLAIPHHKIASGLLYDVKKDQLIMPHNPAPTPVYIYGAGHVGQALIAVTAGLHIDRIWVDVSADRFPNEKPFDVTIVPAVDMSVIAAHAPKDAIHIVMTYSHQFDEAICQALLVRGQFGHLGLIGSQTKKARFAKRLRSAGIAQAMIERLNCPIGLVQIKDKSPAHVALSIAGQIAVWLEMP